MVDISYIIITRNRKDELIKSIKSCFSTTNRSAEIVVVDNGSTDGSIEAVKGLRHPDNFEINLIESAENLGVAGGRNKGTQCAKSDLLFFLDDDAVFDRTYNDVDALIDYFQENMSVAIAAVNIFDDVHQEYQNNEFREANFDDVVQTFRYVGAAHMIRKSLIGRENLYPPKFMYGSEESYAALLAHYEQHKVVFYPTIKIIHHPSLKTRDSAEINHENIMINLFVVKKLLLPNILGCVSNGLFIIRLIRLKKCKLKEILRCYKISKIRLRENWNSRVKIDVVKCFGLIRKLGLKNII